MSSLISAEQHWALWAILLSAAALGLWAERTRWGARISGAVVSILITCLLSNLSLIPVAAPAYDVVWSYIVPLAIPLLLFHADIRRIVREAGPTLVAFGCGAAGTIAGTLLAFALLPLGEEGWKMAGIFCATYIGGSINYAGAAETVGLRSGDLLSAGVAADNLAMTGMFLVLFTLPSIGWLARHYARRDHREDEGAPSGEPRRTEQLERFEIAHLGTALAVAGVASALGYALAGWAGVPSAGILFVTAIVVAAATAFPRWLGRIGGAQGLGILLMQVFFATIGASANIGVVLAVGPILFALAAIILAVHLTVILTAGRLLRLDIAEIVVASNANMGGPSTAAAMAAARNWPALVTPAILCGTLGYATATFLGVAVGQWLR